MRSELNRPSSILLGALVVAVAASGILLALAPVARCPDCAAFPQVPAGETDVPVRFFWNQTGSTGVPNPPASPSPASPPCARCGDGRRISLFNRWFRNAWEGKLVSARTIRGLRMKDRSEVWNLTPIRHGCPVTQRLLDQSRFSLLETGFFEEVKFEVSKYPDTPGRVKVLLVVVER